MRFATMLAALFVISFAPGFISITQAAASIPVFGTVTPVSELNSYMNDSLGSMTGDGLTIVIESRRNLIDNRLWSATRANLFSPFESLNDADFLNLGKVNVGSPVISNDGLTLFFSASGPGGLHFPIYTSTRSTTSEPFGSGVLIPFTNTWDHARPSWLSPDGLRLYFHAGDSGWNLYMTERTSVTSSFESPTIAPFVNFGTSSIDGEATLSPDELQVFFSSDRAGGLGDQDIWWASRPDRITPFSAPINLVTINSNSWDGLPLISGNTLYFTSERNNPTRGDNARDIFSVIIIPEPVLGDMNNDGTVNNQDIREFVLALTYPDIYALAYPHVNLLIVGDLNGDNVFNNQDVSPFAALLTGGGTSMNLNDLRQLNAIPEPTTLGLLMIGSLGLLRRRR